MNITPILQKLPVRNNYQINKNPNLNTNFNSNIKEDVFIKSSNTVSFTSADKNQYNLAKEDLTQYFLNTDKYSIEEIENIIKKYSPATNFDDIKNIPANTNAARGTAAYTYEPTQFVMGNNGNIEAVDLPKTIFLNFKTSAKNEKEAKVILLDRLLHEVTHVLQEDSPKDNKIVFFNNFLATQEDTNKAIANLQAVNTIYNLIEQEMMSRFVNATPTSGSLPKEINKRTDVDTLFMKKYKTSTSTFIKNILKNAMQLGSMKFGKIDKNFVLDFIILKAENEKEAYQNALDSNKELLNINSKTDFDLRIEMYEKIIETAKKIAIKLQELSCTKIEKTIDLSAV